MAIDHPKTVEYHLLIWEILVSYSKHGRMKELHFGIVQDAREILFKSITINFEPEHFVICIVRFKLEMQTWSSNNKK